MIRTLSSVVFWSAASFGIWLLTLSALSVGELVVGSACSLLVGVAAAAAWHAVGVRLSPTASLLRPLRVVPLALVADVVQVLALPVRRRVRGRVETIDIAAAGRSSQAVTLRVVATLGVTMTPASMVLDVDDHGIMTVHALPTRGPRVQQAVADR